MTECDVFTQVHQYWIVNHSRAFNIIGMYEFNRKKNFRHYPIISRIDGTLPGQRKLNLELFFPKPNAGFQKPINLASAFPECFCLIPTTTDSRIIPTVTPCQDREQRAPGRTLTVSWPGQLCGKLLVYQYQYVHAAGYNVEHWETPHYSLRGYLTLHYMTTLPSVAAVQHSCSSAVISCC